MSRCRDLVISAALGMFLAGPALAEGFGLGRPALPEEIAAWDVDVRPDATGLPEGQGSVEDGEQLFSDNCAMCHGDFAEGVDNWPGLSGGFDTLSQDNPVKTVGSYWPYLSTLWDYIHRSKPYGNAQSLEDAEVYALVAFLLYSNDLVDEEFVLNRGNFLEIAMPNASGFIVDDRAVSEYPQFSDVPCMSDCKGVVQITKRASDFDLTPVSNAVMAGANDMDPILLVVGEKVFRKCKACHQIGEEATNKIGPALTGIVGARAGVANGFRYSEAMITAAGSGLVWSPKELAAFLTKPNEYMEGTRMGFSGVKKKDEVEAVIAYLSSFPD